MSSPDNKSSKLDAHALEALQQIVGRDNVEVCEGRCPGAQVCVRPSTEGEVSKIAALGRKSGLKVSSSNRRGVALDGSEADGGIFIDLSKMSSVKAVDRDALSIRAGAGAPLSALISAAAREGMTLGAYPRDRSTRVGQWAVSEAAGFGTYKYGTAKDAALNLRIVTADGPIIETGYDGIGSYMSGYNLGQMFNGSEGSLGVVVEATLRLHPKGEDRLAAYRFEDAAAMQEAMSRIAGHPSLKPRDVSWCGKKMAILATLDGDAAHAALEEQALGELMEGLGSRIEPEDACRLCKWICGGESDGAVEAAVPLKSWKALFEAVGGSHGSVADRGTATFSIKGADAAAVAEKAEALGGRVVGRAKAAWSPLSPPQGPAEGLSRKVTPKVVSELEEAVGKDNVTTNGVDLLLYSKDMAPLPKEAGIAFKNLPDAVVRPSDMKGLSRVVEIARSHGVPVVPRGNSSWGLGGCMPASGGIVVDMSSKFNRVLEINTEELYVKVGAGCTWKALLEACMKKGFIVGSYPSSFPSATVGAWIATNGMGIGSFKYGSAKDNIINMEVVLSDGSVLETGSDHVGAYGTRYNLNQLFSGSEGTLCVFGTVTFRIYPLGALRPLAYYFENLRDMQDAINLISHHPSLRPLHIAFEDATHFANQRKAGSHVPDVKNTLLITYQGEKRFNDLDEAATDELILANKGTKMDGSVGEHEWGERCYEFRARRAGVGEIPAEVIVPNSRWGEFVDECYAGFDAMKMEMGGIIGVIVDRNTALFMPYYFKDDESLLGMTAFAFNFYLGDRAVRYGGRTTGFGVFFAWNLDNVHDAYTVEYMRSLKAALDPCDVVNPGHLVCGKTRFGIKMNKQLMTVGSAVMQFAKKVLPANTTFDDNLKRFRYDTLEHRREEDRRHTLGDGTQ
ncbi:MAG: FAD-binding oxidoreductase [Candidatus Methanoplasma sp.]|jgi:glycolate oxidase|nr:FAD-binding oxidoreductase [Candidatus Methanoplasma sp.]